MKPILLAILVAGCATATEPRPIFAKDGGQALYVECRKSPASCHDAALARCGGPYLPLEDNRRSNTFSDTQGGIHSAARFELTFRCQ
jgi:hypothetical protein